MRHPDPADHAAHDQLLVAAYAAGDAEGTDLQAATALVAACGDCASLHHDLRHIAAALPAMTAPVRPRDFRLTAEQAAALRPAGWRGFLLPLAGPRFSFAAPLGSGLAALGIAGLLLTGGGLSIGAGGATTGAPAPEFQQSAPTQVTVMSGAEAVPTPAAPVAGQPAGNGGAPVAPESTGKSAGTGDATPGDAVAPELGPDAGPVDVVARDGGEPGLPILPAVAALAVVGGVLLASSRVLARRLV